MVKTWVNGNNGAMTDPDFLAAMHAQFEAPRSVVIELAEQASHQGVDHLERLTLGDENEVYRAALSNGTVVYVRIRRPGEGAFAPEVWAMQQAEAAGVPVPRLLGVEELSSDAGPRSAMVIAESPGRQLEKLLPNMSDQQRRRVMANVGRALALIHTVSTPGVDRPGADGRWPDPQRAREDYIAERRSQCSHLTSAGLSAAEAEVVKEQIGTSPDTPPVNHPVLCHGDLHGGHVFVDHDLEVSGVIDWGLWHGGSAVGELATMATAYEAIDLDAMFEGYGIGVQDQDLGRRLALSVINQAVGHIAWHQSIGNASGTAHYVAAIRTALDKVDAP